MRKATETEIKKFCQYRANHVALVQRIGRVVFNMDFSDHDRDKIEADGEKLNLYALRNAMLDGDYHPQKEDKEELSKLAGEHVCSQPHHPEYYDPDITPESFNDSAPPQCLPSGMPDKRIIEMCCDWAAVALKKNQPLFSWPNKTCIGDGRFVFTPHQKKLIVDSTQKIIDMIDKEHLTYPGITYTAKQVEPSEDLLNRKRENNKGLYWINSFKESILDIPQKEYSSDVLTSDDKLRPEVRDQIINTIKKWKSAINFNFKILKVEAKGSLLSKRYTDISDLDVGIYTDMSIQERDSIIDIVPRGQNILVNGKESLHPLDFYILAKDEKTPLKNLDNVYDVIADKWIKRTEEYENDLPINYIMQVCNFMVNGCEISISNYNQSKTVYEQYLLANPETQDIDKDEREAALSSAKEALIASLDGMRIALHLISAFRHEAYSDPANPFKINIEVKGDNPHLSINEMLSKWIEKVGIKEELKACINECEELVEKGA